MMASGWLSVGFAQTRFGVHRGADVVTFEAEHPRKGLGNALVVVDNQDGRRLPARLLGWTPYSLYQGEPEYGRR